MITEVTEITGKHPAQRRIALRPLTPALLRIPALPVEFYRRLAGANAREVEDLARSQPVDAALAVASPSLHAALYKRNLTEKEARHRTSRLLRYLIRISTRPTPFGLFSSVALIGWGERTDLQIAQAIGRRRTRPDMEWLMEMVLSLEEQPQVRRALRLQANPACQIRAGRVQLAEGAPASGALRGRAVRVRATDAVQLVLTMARELIDYEVLAAALIRLPGGTPDRAAQLIDRLWRDTILLTDLRPPLDVANPARYVLERLDGLPGAGQAHATLSRFLSVSAAADADADLSSLPSRYLDLAKIGHGANASRSSFQVDSAASLEGVTISATVGREAARAAELLLSLSPGVRGFSSLSGYRRAFQARYGPGHEVPLLDVLDAERGLGPYPLRGRAFGQMEGGRSSTRADALLELAMRGIRDGVTEVELSDADIERLRPGESIEFPPSLDISVQIGARSRAGLDAGEFDVVVAPNLGAMSGGRNLARFTDLLGDDAVKGLRQVATIDIGREPGGIVAALVYMPPRLRAGNVVIHIPVHSHAIVIGTSPAPGPIQIRPDELLVGVRRNRLYLRWARTGEEVLVAHTTMLNPANAPDICRFLADVSRDGTTQLSSFDWGPAASFPYLPRVRSGRAVLSPAQWRLASVEVGPASSAPGVARLHQFIKRWGVPSLGYLTSSDNRLLLDLEDPLQMAELQSEVQGLKGNQAVRMQEVLPSPDDAWLEGPDGHYLCEVVVTLARSAKSVEVSTGASDSTLQNARPASPVSPALRVRPPGSDWLYLKLYCPRSFENEVIAGEITAVCDDAVRRGWANRWFFIRYADPESHLRVRLQGNPHKLQSRVLPRLNAIATRLVETDVASRFSYDTYEREVERYGSPDGIVAAEEIFAADTSFAHAVVRAWQEGKWEIDALAVAVASCFDLLSCLGLSPAERTVWCRVHLPVAAGAEWRTRKAALRALLSGGGGRNGPELRVLLARRHVAVIRAAETLRRLRTQGVFDPDGAQPYLDLTHLHLNRLLGASSPDEQRVLGLLRRANESLGAAPSVRLD